MQQQPYFFMLDWVDYSTSDTLYLLILMLYTSPNHPNIIAFMFYNSYSLLLRIRF